MALKKLSEIHLLGRLYPFNPLLAHLVRQRWAPYLNTESSLSTLVAHSKGTPPQPSRPPKQITLSRPKMYLAFLFSHVILLFSFWHYS
jgi:hypothetical protein